MAISSNVVPVADVLRSVRPEARKMFTWFRLFLRKMRGPSVHGASVLQLINSWFGVMAKILTSCLIAGLRHPGFGTMGVPSPRATEESHGRTVCRS